jgi:uncharacterized membrane-anchored protein
MKYGLLLVFSLLIIIQWIVPGKIIWTKNQVLENGEVYKFQTEPIDPSNPFKGKYIILNFKENAYTDTIDRELTYGEVVYVIFNKNDAGYATIKNLSKTKPSGNFGYVKANVYYTSRQKASITVHINYTFDEFYMDEFKAPKAENIYREANRDSLNRTYAVVKIWKGDAVIEDVLINDIPIKDLIKN